MLKFCWLVSVLLVFRWHHDSGSGSILMVVGVGSMSDMGLLGGGFCRR